MWKLDNNGNAYNTDDPRDFMFVKRDYAFQDPSAYRKLREKYRRAKAGRKKFAILDIMQAQWCKTE